MPSPQLVDLSDRYEAQSRAFFDRVLVYLGAAWTGMGSWHAKDVNRFVGRAVPVVRGAQVRLSSLTDAYLARVATIVLEEPTAPIGVSTVLLDDLRGGVPMAEVYARPGHAMWTALSDGSSLHDAIDVGRDRLDAIASTDLQLARTHTARAVFMQDKRVSGYRRVATPGHCKLCGLASQRTYHRGDLLPIHPRCRCSVEPIYRGRDTPKLPAGEPSDEDRGDKVAVHVHGEIGPVLTVAGQHFEGPGDL